MSEIYLINEAVSVFRWVGVAKDDPGWGTRLVRLKGEAVADQWSPIPVEWLPETIGRKIADFPNFRPNLRCVSNMAASKLEKFLSDAGEFLELVGLDGAYKGYHCLKEIDAMHRLAVEKALSEDKYASFHSPRFVPELLMNKVSGADVFRIPESFAKIFVSKRFKKIYDNESLTGLDFYPVSLAR